jgi:hypothetical protein
VQRIGVSENWFVGGIRTLTCGNSLHLRALLTHTILCLYVYSYIGYGKDQIDEGMSAKEESLMAFFALVQSILLGSFAAILAAHRSEILDKPGSKSTVFAALRFVVCNCTAITDQLFPVLHFQRQSWT